MLNELHQNTSCAPGMKERDEVAGGAGARFGVDELDAGFGQQAQVFGKVLAQVGDVVKAGPPALDEPAHGGVGTQGLDELDLAAEADSDALAGDGFRLGATGPGEALVKESGLVEGRNRDGHVMEWSAVGRKDIHGGPAQRWMRDKALAAS
jgi:hypothetical protein